MKRGESAKLLAMVHQIYPNAKAADNQVAQANSWALVLRDWSYEQMEAALVAFAANDKKGFPPSPGQLIDTAINLTQKGDELTEQEAWSLVQRALSNGTYGYREEYAKLPPLVRACIGSPNQLREWAQTDASAINTVTASNFMRSYRAKKASKDRYARTPEFIQAASDKLFPAPQEAPALTEGEEQDRKLDLIKKLSIGGKQDRRCVERRRYTRRTNAVQRALGEDREG